MAERVTDQQQAALGFYADIPQAFWRRITRYHVPVKWFACWFGVVVLQFVLGFMICPWHWLVTLGGGLGLALAELICLQWLTWADPQWDGAMTARDCRYYEAN